MRHALGLSLLCAVAAVGCSDSRRNVRKAPGKPEVFATRLPEETAPMDPEEVDPEQGCGPWNGAAWCTTLLSGWSFVPEAIDACAAEPDEDSAIDCLSYAADRRFSTLALETCAGLEAPKHRLACLDATADRALETPQFAYCSEQPSKKVPGCLADMHDYMFHPNELHELVKRTVEQNPSDPTTIIAALEANVAETYALDRSIWPDHYVFNFAGGATTHIRSMYCAFDEYLLIVGAPIEVNGYSGRYPAEVHDFVFTGLMHDFEEHEHVDQEREPGTWAYLPHGGHRVYSTETPTYMLEYARGWVPGMLGFGIRHPRRAITRDRKNMKQQIRMCASRALAAQKENRRRKRRRRAEKRETLRAIRRTLRDL